MADQQSRGGKKQGNAGDKGESEKHQGVHTAEGEEGTTKRPAEGQPGGPKPNHGQTRPEKK